MFFSLGTFGGRAGGRFLSTISSSALRTACMHLRCRAAVAPVLHPRGKQHSHYNKRFFHFTSTQHAHSRRLRMSSLMLLKTACIACTSAQGTELQHDLAAHRLNDRTWQCGIWCEDLGHPQTNPLNIVISDHLASSTTPSQRPCVPGCSSTPLPLGAIAPVLSCCKASRRLKMASGRHIQVGWATDPPQVSAPKVMPQHVVQGVQFSRPQIYRLAVPG